MWYYALTFVMSDNVMNDRDFDQLTGSLKEAIAISKGDAHPARSTCYNASGKLDILSENNVPKFKLVTSNLNKLAEFNRLVGSDFFEIATGKDLQEIQSDDHILVSIHKALEAGERCIIEDTVLEVDSHVVSDIRYKLDELANKVTKSPLRWICTLAFLNQGEVKVFSKSISGFFRATDCVPKDSFGFDAFFVPQGTDKSLYELEKEGLKDTYSARKLVVNALIADDFCHKVLVTDIEPWAGDYQA